MERLIDYMKNTKEEAYVYDEFRSYISQCDFRRNVEFIETFPELAYLMRGNYYG